ncbi:hypothetical protein FW774_17325 [Pedobacter sp. BS3]|uniref:hypothetical protein n=1 Tax=Pedobacter sp. BS3 TaxID=2567937 RepID=UPI0011EBC31E|nr:hypothetical protein [Pedobacter sp. BS3]TZF81817.1 hypothetical protein FW774_17325 [Pedobacter sp. BS3]
MKNEFLERLKDFFAKNEGEDKVYATSDGNLFRAKHYAESWASGLKDKAVTTYYKAIVEKFGDKLADTPGEADPANGDKKPADNTDPASTENADKSKPADNTGEADGDKDKSEKSADDERAALVKRYIELYDSKPSNFMKTENIAAKIAEKEAELKAAEKASK